MNGIELKSSETKETTDSSKYTLDNTPTTPPPSTTTPPTTPPSSFNYPKPNGRVLVVDWWKGLSIFLMLVSHYITYGIDQMGDTIGGGPWIFIGLLQLSNGLFFFLSAFGNYISIKKLLDRKVPLKQVAGIVLLRGVILIALSLLAGAVFRKWLSKTLYPWIEMDHVLKPTEMKDTSKNNFGTHLISNLFDPVVVPYIGFNTAMSSILLLLMTHKARQDHQVSNTKRWTLTDKLKTIGKIAVFVLFLNIPLRIVLDRTTHPVGWNCQTMYNKTQVAAAPSRFPSKCYVTHSKNLDFSDNTEWQPCFNITDFNNNPNNVSWPVLNGFNTKDSMTGQNVWNSQKRCQLFMKHFKKTLPNFALAHLSDTQRGYRWCPTNVQRDAILPTQEDFKNPKLELCVLTPWWGPPIGTGSMLTMITWDRLTTSQRIYNLFTWPWLGRYGFFAYGANALLGIGVAMYVCDENGGWTPMLFKYLYQISFMMMVIGMGPALSLFIIEADSNETAQMASTWMRLLFGGIELMAFTVFAHVMEARPTNGCLSCCGKNSKCCCNSCKCCVRGSFGAPQFQNHWFYRMCRRYGAISLTIYIIQHFIFDTTSIIINSIGKFIPPFCFDSQFGHLYSMDSQCGIANKNGDATTNYGIVLLYLVINLLVFTMIVWSWSKIHFIGSFEWMIQKILTLARGSKSTSITINVNQNRGGDCTCRGFNSKECCNIYLFCCGACENKRKDEDQNNMTKGDNVDIDIDDEENDEDIQEEKRIINEVDCTGNVGTWGFRAGTLVTVLLLGIMAGAQ